MPGELYIGGDGLSLGYLRRPDLTAERFVPDPFSADPGARLYRSGDRVRRRASGEIEYLGRLDHQVKVRGYRIELGEIEVAITQHPSVKEAVVLAREDVPGTKRLVAYVTGAEGATPDEAALRAFLAASLPDFMVPGVFVVLDALPLTANGNVDRRALPAPGASSVEAGGLGGPRNATEEPLCQTWASLLPRK